MHANLSTAPSIHPISSFSFPHRNSSKRWGSARAWPLPHQHLWSFFSWCCNTLTIHPASHTRPSRMHSWQTYLCFTASGCLALWIVNHKCPHLNPKKGPGKSKAPTNIMAYLCMFTCKNGLEIRQHYVVHNRFISKKSRLMGCFIFYQMLTKCSV